MTRQPSPTSDSPTSWSGFKDLARRQYEQGNYEDAVTSYTAALNPELRCPASEQQILLSNLIACRLKIGGAAQARAALDNSKQCIALNPNWAKGHVRLASAYIALGGHSNDACNALQRALSLDPGNTTAREMLLRELRRDHAHASSSSRETLAGESGASAPNNTGASDRDYGATSSAQHNQNDHYRYNDNNDDAVVDELTWSERLHFHVGRAMSYYQSQSDDVKTVFKIIVVLLVLYVGFGGRFGLGGETRQLGNYGSNNVYDQYRRHGTTSSHHSDPQSNTHSASYPYNNNNQRRHSHYHYDDHSSSSSHRRASQHHQDNYYDDDQQYYDARPQRGGGNSWSLGGFRPFDGGMQSMLLLGGLVYAGQRMGINPFQTMMIVNALGGGRQRIRRPRGFGMGGFGVGGMGGMGGMGRRRRY